MTKKFLLVLDHKNSEMKVLLDKVKDLIKGEIKVESFIIEETFLNVQSTSNTIDSNVLQKTGKNDSYTYTHEIRQTVNGEKI